jgi:hypothetical protein
LPNKIKEKEKKNMKYKALMLSLLLLLPMIAALPAFATQNVVAELGVVPRATKFYGPCVKSTTFKIDVNLWNNPLSGVDVYAFDFYIDWFAGVSLVKAEYHSPWANFYEVANGTSGPMTYHLALTAIPPSTGLFTVDQSVLTLTFHIDNDICWPDTLHGVFHLHGVKMSSDGTETKPIVLMEIDDGTYDQFSVQPNIELTSTAANATGWIIQKCISHTFDVEVDLTNVTNLYGFSFTLTYDALHLETDVQKVTFKSAFPPPYETLSVTVVQGTITVSLMRPSEKPGVCGAVVPAVDIIFHTIDDVPGEEADGVIPTTSISQIYLDAAEVYVKCPSPATYYLGFDLLSPVRFLTYYFKPSSFDLNLDCVVDIQDLKVLLPYYGTTTAVGGYGDLYLDGAQLVDIFDFVSIAKHFGPVDP